MMGLGIWKYIGIGLAAIALIAVIVTGVKQCKQIEQQNDNTLVNAGVTQERSASQSETINAVQNAQNVVRAPSSEQLNVVCSKYDRNCSPHRP